jgi:hypothetical protein
LRLNNQTPLEAVAFRQFASDGSLDCVVSVRGSFFHQQDAELGLAQEQVPFQFEDIYQGDPHKSDLLLPSDLVPEKPGTDVSFLGSSFAPYGEAASRWTCGIRVGDRLHKRLLVSGPRYWQPQTKRTWSGLLERNPKPKLVGWDLSEPEPTRQVTLSWTKSFGGPVSKLPSDDTPADVHRENPLGPGLLDTRYIDLAAPVTAHQIDDPDDPVTDWSRHDACPHGFGLVSPWWRQRQQFTGTYDDVWLKERHPLLPLDFDARFWQYAHPDLIAIPHLRGDEDYELSNLHAELARARGRLPGAALGIHCDGGDSSSAGWHAMALDGVHFDFRDARNLVMLTWRARFRLNDAARAVLTLKRIRVTTEAGRLPEAAE